MHAVAAKLHDRGIEARWPKYGDSRRLAIANARGARSDITAEDCGFVTWDYWPYTGPATDPADLAAIVRDVLGAPATTRAPATRGTLPLKGAVGRMLRANGLKVTLAAYQDDVALDVITEIVVTNPAIPSCGLVRSPTRPPNAPWPSLTPLSPSSPTTHKGSPVHFPAGSAGK